MAIFIDGTKVSACYLYDDKILTIKTFINLKKKLCRIRNSCIIQKAGNQWKLWKRSSWDLSPEHKKLEENLSELTYWNLGASQEFGGENIWVLMQEKTTEAWQKILRHSHLPLAPSFLSLWQCSGLKGSSTQSQYGNQPQGEQEKICPWGTVCLAWLQFLWRTQ